MEERLSFFKGPDYVPTKWLVAVVAVLVGMLSTAIAIGIWIEGVDSRLSATELRAAGIVEELKYRQELRVKIMEKLDSIDHRLSQIEGRLTKR